MVDYNKIKLEPLYDTVELKDISDSTYFSNQYVQYISNSKLALINPSQGGSPEKYKAGFTKTGSDSLYFGNCVHQLILQPDEFELIENVNRPTAKLGLMADELYRFFRDEHTVSDEHIIEASNKINYYKGLMDENHIIHVCEACTPYWEGKYMHTHPVKDKEPVILDPKGREKLKHCLNSVNNNKQIQKLLHPKGCFEDPIIMNEAALFIDFKATNTETNESIILHFKGKLDNFTIDKEFNTVVLNDLKTSRHYFGKFHESFEQYHYARQMGAYIWLLKQYIKKYENIIPEHLTANMLVVSTVPEYTSGVYKVSKNQIINGFTEFIELMKRAAAVEFETKEL